MFAVPGWSLPDRVTTQTVQAKEKAPDLNRNELTQEPKKPQKRKKSKDKRPHDPQPSVESRPTLPTAGDGAPAKQKDRIRNDLQPSVDSRPTHPITGDGAPTRQKTGAEPQTKAKSQTKPAVKVEQEEDENPRKKRKTDADKPGPSNESKGPKNAPKPKEASQPAPKPAPSIPKPVTAPAPAQQKLTPLQMKMKAKLTSARFRHLNETLYTKSSSDSLSMITTDPTLFTEYHDGFSQQVSAWPENPVDGYVNDILKRGSIHQFKTKADKFKPSLLDVPLPRDRRTGLCHMVDLGAGTAPLARALDKSVRKMNVKLASFDLHSTSPHVQIADVANLPLKDGSVDVAIFCLALMGTNWLDFIDEAYRVLHWKGELWVAEVKSRFARTGPSSSSSPSSSDPKPKGGKGKKKRNNGDDDDDADHHGDGAVEPRQLKDYIVDEIDGDGKVVGHTDVNPFIDTLHKRGFVLNGSKSVEMDNKMFVKMWFVKGATPSKGKNKPTDRRALEQHGAESSVEVKKRKGKFLDDPDDDDEAESKVLKPCVYKIR